MHSLLFSLEASLLVPLLEFALSPSGHVEPRRGLALGWLGSVVAGLAVVFGTADRAQAHDCYGLSEGDCTRAERTYSPCTDGCPPPIVGEWYKKFCHYHNPDSCVEVYECWC